MVVVKDLKESCVVARKIELEKVVVGLLGKIWIRSTRILRRGKNILSGTATRNERKRIDQLKSGVSGRDPYIPFILSAGR